MTKPHVIGVQRFDLKMKDRSKAMEWQGSLSDYTGGKFLKTLENAFDRVPEDINIKIPKLEIDAGILDPRHFIEQLDAVIENALNKEIKGLFLKLAAKEVADQKNSEEEATIVEKDHIEQREGKNDFEDLVSYLESGHRPWNWPQDKKFKPKEIFTSFFYKRTFELLYRKELLKTPLAFFRLLHLTGPELLLEKVTGSVKTNYRPWTALWHKAQNGESLSHFIYHLLWQILLTEENVSAAIYPDTMLANYLYKLNIKRDSALWNLILTEAGFLKLNKSVREIKKLNKVKCRTIADYLLKFPLRLSDTAIRSMEEKLQDKGIPKVRGVPAEELLLCGNAGIVLCWPFLKDLFRNLRFLNDLNQFVSKRVKRRAVHILNSLAGGGKIESEDELLLSKILCGMDTGEMVELKFRLTKEEKTEVRLMLEAILATWPALRTSNTGVFKQNFFMRNGNIHISPSEVKLKIERQGIDILLEKLPWPLSVISLPWNPYLIWTEW